MRECALPRRAPVEGGLYVGKETGNSGDLLNTSNGVGRSQASGWTLMTPHYYFIFYSSMAVNTLY